MHNHTQKKKLFICKSNRVSYIIVIFSHVHPSELTQLNDINHSSGSTHSTASGTQGSRLERATPYNIDHATAQSVDHRLFSPCQVKSSSDQTENAGQCLRWNIYVTAMNSSVRSLDQLGRRGDMRDDSADIFLQSLLQEALVSSSGTGKMSTL